MLAIISDLHLTDGTSGQTIQAGAFEIFAERLEDMAYRASWRADGQYRPVDRVDVLLLGDVLDVIRSTRWLSHSDIRPWMDIESPALCGLVGEINNKILEQNEASLAVLRSLTEEGGLVLPAADSKGQPASGRNAAHPVPVYMHYLVGNHDWFYHIASPAYDPIRQSVIDAIGLSQPANEPFAHDPHESAELLDVLRRHRVFARHGDIYDPFNFEGDRSKSSLGDAIVIELLNRFPNAVEQRLGNDLPDATLEALREIDNVRPLLLIPVWVEGVLERTCPFPKLRLEVKRIWDELADQFLNLPFVRARDTWNPADIVDGLQKVLKFSKTISLQWAVSIIELVRKMRGVSDDSYASHALAEQDFRNRRAKHIIYGHTHFAESVPLDASYAEGYVLNQMYFNSGTWRRMHRATILAPQEHEFIPSDAMTYLAFYQGDERGGRSYETWSGTLGISPITGPIRRIEREVPTQKVEVHAATPSVRGPHFAAAKKSTGTSSRRSKS